MLFLKCNAVCLLRRCYYPLASTLVKYHYANLPASGVTSPYRSTLTTARSLSITWTLRADAPQPKDTQTLDLDIWKSVMKSQTVQEEKPNGEEESSSTEEGELSPLEASRRLVETWRQAGRQVPDYVTDEQLESLAELTTKSSKRKYLKFLAIKEGHKKANKEKKEKRRMERKEWMGRVDSEPEGENGEAKLNNTFLLKFWSRSKDKVLGWRAAQAMQFGQPLIFDMSYEQHMSRMEIQNTISQLLETEGWNRRATDPFHLHFCNLQPDSSYQREFLKRYGPETWQSLLITTTSQSHVDLFPRESLVYLTADSRNVLYTFNHSKVYIIGALVDRSSQSAVSLANAKRLNLATARLPLDEFLHWECGAKNLTLDQMIRILLTAKDTGSWEKALEFVPKRKHDGFYKHTRENEAKSTPLVTGGKPVNSNRNPARERAKIFVSKQKNPKGQGVDWKRSFESDNTMSGQTRLRSTLKSKMEERHKTE